MIRKRVAVKLPKEMTKAKILAEMIPGLIMGKVIFINVLSLLAPKTLAASSRERSKRYKLAEMTLTV